ncbi:MAG: hypothetical protein H6925_03875 [Holosporaceae bacterium]|nr:MAG: hypothetical protein H6925_03875 [Holosporaceae bacterium]
MLVIFLAFVILLPLLPLQQQQKRRGGAGRRYKMPTLNGEPFPGWAKKKIEFLVELCFEPGKLDSFSIEGNNIRFGKSSLDLTIDGKPGTMEEYLARIIGKNSESITCPSSASGQKKVNADDLGSQRAVRLTVVGDHLESPVPFSLTSPLDWFSS